MQESRNSNNASSSSLPPISPAEVDRIVALDDQPVLRNLLISQAYHDLSDAMAELLGERKNIVWVTMASWSSKTAGRFIRDDELPALFKDVLRKSAPMQRQLAMLSEYLRAIHPSLGIDPVERLFGAVDRILRAASAYLTLGNKIVFAELGAIFASFIATFSGDRSPDDSKLDRYLATIPEGAPQPDEIIGDARTGKLTYRELGGKTLLRKSMANYYKAWFTQDAKQRAELIYFANGQGGVHEQTRLQPYIAGSLDAASSDIFYNEYQDALMQVLVDKTLVAPLRTLLEQQLRPLSSEFARLFREFATAELMKLKLPDRELILGRDVLAAPGQPQFPPDLQTIANPDLRDVLKEYDALGEPKPQKQQQRKGLLEQFADGARDMISDLGLMPESVRGSGARDWADLWQRMRYILPLFRSRAQDPALFGHIFSESQRQALARNEIPEGPLY